MKFKTSGVGMGWITLIVVFGSLSQKCLSENRFIEFFRQALLISKYLSHQIVILGLCPEYLLFSKLKRDTRVKPEYDGRGCCSAESR